MGIIVILMPCYWLFGHHAREIPSAFGAVQHGLGLWSNFGLAMICSSLGLCKAGSSAPTAPAKLLIRRKHFHALF